MKVEKKQNTDWRSSCMWQIRKNVLEENVDIFPVSHFLVKIQILEEILTRHYENSSQALFTSLSLYKVKTS